MSMCCSELLLPSICVHKFSIYFHVPFILPHSYTEYFSACHIVKIIQGG